MKKCRTLCLLVLAMICLLAGCGGLDDVKETTISISSKGAVTEVIIGSADKKSYSAEELQSFVEDDIKAYNENAKSENIKLKSCEIKDKVSRIEITYASYTDYAAYHRTTLYYGTLKEAESAGYDFDVDFIDNNGEAAAKSTILSNDNDWKVVILEEPVDVMVSGDILYVSNNAEISAKREVKIAEAGEAKTITTDSLVYLIYK
ncbi:MAG TPA: hypothetical protein IAC62_10845 [Candidatus Pelethocola excrementipullorum]|nr:hypothetical protein [Candidatus Pelethocola excrementipullorum]